MEKKYWVPSIEKANDVLKIISQHPGEYRLIDMAENLQINKSSLFSLLNTLEDLNWVIKNNNVYDLGPAIGGFNAAYLKQFNLIQSFYKEAQKSVSKIDEPIQLGMLDGTDVVYLGKVNNNSNVRLVTDPGMRYPAYASAIGKAQMLNYSKKDLKEVFLDCKWEKKTPYTTESFSELYEKVIFAKEKGYSVENEESAIGFHCIAAPVYNFENKIIAGVSFSMPTSSWENKFSSGKKEIINLANSLSGLAGFTRKFEYYNNS